MTDYGKAVRRGWIGGALFMVGAVMATQDWFGLEGYIAHLRGGAWIDLPWWVGCLIAAGAVWWAHKTPNAGVTGAEPQAERPR